MKKNKFTLRLPDFICVGAQKAGTTYLFHMLNKHKDIYLPPKKELFFFNLQRNYSLGLKKYSSELTEGYSGQSVLGEISTTYMYDCNVPKRMFDLLRGEIKIIFMLRNPVDRAYSHYIMNKKTGREKTFSFFNALRLEARGEAKTNYINYGLYARHIKPFLKYFDKKNMFFIVFDDLFSENENFIGSELSKFLGVTQIEFDRRAIVNSGTVPRLRIFKVVYSNDKMVAAVRRVVSSWPALKKLLFFLFLKKPVGLSASMRKKLTGEYFMSDILELEKILNFSLKKWYE